MKLLDIGVPIGGNNPLTATGEKKRISQLIKRLEVVSVNGSLDPDPDPISMKKGENNTKIREQENQIHWRGKGKIYLSMESVKHRLDASLSLSFSVCLVRSVDGECDQPGSRLV